MIDLPQINPASSTRKPDWLRVKLPIGEKYTNVRKLWMNINYIPFAKVEIVRIWANVGAKEQPPL